jgi:hypothetical protein
MDQESSKQLRSLNINNENEKVIKSKPVINRRIRSQQSDDLSSTNDLSINSQQDEDLIQNHISKFISFIELNLKIYSLGSDLALSNSKYSSKNAFLLPICIVM